MAAISFPERVAARAVTIRPARLLLSLLACPFYLLGLLVGLLIVVFTWGYSAVLIGVDDARSHGRQGDG